MIPLELLQSFCIEKESGRIRVMQPFTRGDFSYATDGHIVVRVAARADVPADQYDVKVEPLFVPPVGELVPVPPVDLGPEPVHVVKPCTKCQTHGRFTAITCETCRGTGEVKCGSCGHKDECATCDGTGISSRTPDPAGDEECEACDATGDENHGRVVHYPIEVLGYHIDRPVLKKLLALPGLRIDARGNRKGVRAVAFAFDGGDGMVMPMVMDEQDLPPEYRSDAEAA